MARSYTVPIQGNATIGDIVVVGVYGVSAVGATPSGWSLLANVGVICALYSHTVASGEPGTSVDFPLGSNNKVACFVLEITGATGITANLHPSAGAVASLAFTTNTTADTLIIAGCFSTLTQTFGNVFTLPVINVAVPMGLIPLNQSGLGTNAPSVTFGPTTSATLLTFPASHSSALIGFELDVAGATPAVSTYFSTTESDIPPSSPALSQQTTGHGTATPFSMPALTLSTNDALVFCAAFWNSTTSITETVSDNNSGGWTEVTGCPTDNTSSSFDIHGDIWYSVGHLSGSTTVTSTLSATPTNIYVNLSTYTGIATANPVDTQTTKIGAATGTTLQTGTINTTTPVDLLVGCCVGDADNGAVPTITDYGTSGGSPTGLSRTSPTALSFIWPAFQVVAATGNYGFQFVITSSPNWSGAIVALKGISTAPLPIFHRARRKRPRVLVHATHVVRNRIQFITRPNFIESPILRHRQQPHRVFVPKAKRIVRSNIELRIPQAPPAIFPPVLRHGRQPKRRSPVKGKRRVSERLGLPPQPQNAIPRPPKRQRKLTAVVHKRQLGSSVELRVAPQRRPKWPLPLPIFAKHRVKRRLVVRGKKSWILVFYGTTVVTPPSVAIVVWRHRAGMQ